ncbi:Protein of unknown function [Gryllus bimaculatus]|nr:Protein of unknown function [Gryllus bimaculatus]
MKIDWLVGDSAKVMRPPLNNGGGGGGGEVAQDVESCSVSGKVCLHQYREDTSALQHVSTSAAPNSLLWASEGSDTTPSLLETLCLSQGKLLHDGDCYTPLETGPCSEHEWFVMNSDASAEGYCSSRPCAAEEVTFQTHCLTQADARARLCQGDAVHLGPAGRPRCGPHPGWPALLAAHVQCSLSLQRKPLSSPSLSLSLSTPSEPNGRVVHSSGHNCGANDENECVLEVRGSSAAPELEAET